MARVRLSGRGRRRYLSGHPWIFANDLSDVAAAAGELVAIEDPGGQVLGYGFYSQASKIAVRTVSQGGSAPDRSFWEERMQRAVRVRQAAGLLEPTAACRLIAGDADGFPGLVVDRYGDALVWQSGTLAADLRRQEWLELLELYSPISYKTILDRSDSSARRLEALAERVELLRGDASAGVLVHEGGAVLRVDLLGGQKTGAYLDQRDNRAATALAAAGARMLDAFAFEGWFGIQAALAGAERVLCVEQSREACQRICENAAANGVAERVEVVRANCMQDLRLRSEEGQRYEIVVVDPPPFARNKRELEGAERGYVELNRRAAQLVGRDGLLVSASCSYHVLPEDFVEYLRSALSLAGRDAWLTALRGAPLDHPYRLSLPESNYLKCAFLRLD